MFGFGPATRIYVATGATDMRKSFNGLYGLVRDTLGCDPQSGHVFVFGHKDLICETHSAMATSRQAATATNARATRPRIRSRWVSMLACN